MNDKNNQDCKADLGKLEIDLVPTQIIRDIAQVRMYGNKKYGSADNWKQVELRRYINAMLRHTLAFLDNPQGVDEESGIKHYKHAECNWAFISAMLGESKPTETPEQTLKCEDCAHMMYQEKDYIFCGLWGVRMLGGCTVCGDYEEKREK